jgi:hypothetical protein
MVVQKAPSSLSPGRRRISHQRSKSPAAARGRPSRSGVTICKYIACQQQIPTLGYYFSPHRINHTPWQVLSGGAAAYRYRLRPWRWSRNGINLITLYSMEWGTRN